MEEVRVGTADAAVVLENDLDLVADLATALLELPSEAEIYRRVGDGLWQAVGENAIIVVTNQVPQTLAFKTQVVLGLGPIVEKATALIGKHPTEIAGDWPDSIKRVMATGRLTRIEGGVAALVGDVIPAAIGRRAQALFGLEEVFVVGFSKGGSAGGICIITRRPGATVRRATIEAMARLAAVAIERKRLEEQLIRAQKMETVGQLASGVAHDFNNILAAMVLQLDLLRLRPGLPPDRVSRAVDELLGSAERAASLVRQLLVFGCRQAMETSRCDLNAVVFEWTAMLRRLLGEQVTLTVDRCEEPLWFDGDAGMIEQVVTNLCVNARDAMPNGGQLKVTTRAVVIDADAVRRHHAALPGGYACLKVADTGCGVDPAIRARLFEPFFTTKEPGKGSGLGLAIVQGIVARHGGFVEVESRPGEGSAFSVYLPRAATAGREEPRGAPSDLRGGGESILVVEDDPAVRRVTVVCLRELGYRVTEAENGVDALEIWESEGGRFDLLLTDMVMPGGLSGLELCSRLMKARAGLKAIVVGGYGTEAADDGAAVTSDVTSDVTFLSKPFDVKKLAAAVRERLDRKP